MKLLLKICTIILGTIGTAFGNTDTRTWTLTDNTKIRAELLHYNPETEAVKLLIDNTSERILAYNDFSTFDQAWLVEWSEFSVILKEKLKQHRGTFEHLTVEGQFTTDLFVYKPSSLKSDQQSQAPLLILFHPGGKAARFLMRHIEASEETGMMMVTCSHFRNSNNDQANAMMLERFKEVLPAIERKIPHHPLKLFIGGSSGGAMKAFGYSTLIERPWAGIYSNGGWLGGADYYDLDYPNMRVAMVSGNQDEPARHWLEPDMKILERSGCEIGVFIFEGGHQVAPPSTQIKAILWLLEDERVQ